ncbi:Bifunctional inhibitor/plant lipid transfer protein/seed storage helical domain containing protein [Parasponia andersonii]|uniref:Bifunctional inhibitor/plant lipid transfer protein/seed storage helical domain containing protein n=1 Tax=Parasponia andersonii TaxID=3476 RepID=A0A2P5DW38_PARAD|nr:Bifunctional inhibitor/plant lipid transfer protein/seed storage helical domain containing protein [Parasponia andersonii]
MMNKSSALCAVAVMAATMLLSEALTPPVQLSLGPPPSVKPAAVCEPTELISCLNKFRGSQSKPCCSKLQEQEPCLCGYIEDPKLAEYFNTTHARVFASKCGVPFPKC